MAERFSSNSQSGSFREQLLSGDLSADDAANIKAEVWMLKINLWYLLEVLSFKGRQQTCLWWFSFFVVHNRVGFDDGGPAKREGKESQGQDGRKHDYHIPGELGFLSDCIVTCPCTLSVWQCRVLASRLKSAASVMWRMRATHRCSSPHSAQSLPLVTPPPPPPPPPDKKDTHIYIYIKDTHTHIYIYCK